MPKITASARASQRCVAHAQHMSVHVSMHIFQAKSAHAIRSFSSFGSLDKTSSVSRFRLRDGGLTVPSTNYYACAHVCVRLRTCVRACVRAYLCACVRACVLACMRACVRAFVRSCMCACVHQSQRRFISPELLRPQSPMTGTDYNAF